MSDRYVCVYCGQSHGSPSGTGTDVVCCGEVGHVEPDAAYILRVFRKADGAIVDEMRLINEAALLTGKCVAKNHYPADDYHIEVMESV